MYCLNSTATIFGGGASGTGDTTIICTMYLSNTNEIIVAGHSSSSNLVTLNGALSRPFIAKYNSLSVVQYAKQIKNTYSQYFLTVWGCSVDSTQTYLTVIHDNKNFVAIYDTATGTL